MKLEEAKRFKQRFYDFDKIDARWDKQVWFWQRRKIHRLSFDSTSFHVDDGDDIFEQVSKLNDDATGSLNGIGFQHRGMFTVFKIAFRTKKDAMLFKLAHG